MQIALPLNSSITMRRNDPHYPLARVTVTDAAILVEFGRISWGRWLTVKKVECLPLCAYPEFAGLYDCGVWDIDMLHSLISPAINEETENQS